jgi:hypothetical protein
MAGKNSGEELGDAHLVSNSTADARSRETFRLSRSLRCLPAVYPEEGHFGGLATPADMWIANHWSILG